MAMQHQAGSDVDIKPILIRSDKIKKDILQHLKSAEFGLNITQLADELKFSRNTVTKYLEVLRSERMAYYKDMGPAKIWFNQQNRRRNPDSRMPELIREFIIETVNSLERHNIMPANELNALFHDVGGEVANKIAWPSEFVSAIKDFDARSLCMVEIKKVVEDFFSILKDMGYFLRPEIVPNVGKDPNSPILIRATFHNDNWGNFKQYYNLMAGFFERKLQLSNPNIYLKVKEIEPEGTWCYYELGLNREGVL